MIKVILVEDHLVVRDGIKLLLDTAGDIEIMNEAKDGSELADILSLGPIPDILITDINMPCMSGMEVITMLKKKYPSVKVIVLSMLNTLDQLLLAFENGAKGYLVKNVSYNELLFAVRHIHSGGQYVCEELVSLMMDTLSSNPLLPHMTSKELPIDLTERELEVLQLISEGYTNMQIADKLFLSKRTVEGHRQILINKAEVKNSAELIKFAVQHKLVI